MQSLNEILVWLGFRSIFVNHEFKTIEKQIKNEFIIYQQDPFVGL